MEYFIGQEIELIHDNKTIKLKIEKSTRDTCENCFFLGKRKDGACLRERYNLSTAYCTHLFRNDNQDIIFKQIK